MVHISPRIEYCKGKKLVGNRMQMSFADYRITELWQRFKQHQNEIKNTLNDEFISLVVYKPNHFLDFKPTTLFERWATQEVADFTGVPETMETFALEEGLYAVFNYKGLSSNNEIFQYIFGTWLPQSAYDLDNRPHFEVLGTLYKNNDPISEEEIWIPIKEKKENSEI